ncbi:predicted protein [Nematostella vectensis]|uniref:b(0,+)-type amino acid transporter 1 n=1 Tax=Nematostella vectensis TaxID=45351 RepID=A7S561_NEMVE|nr:predicted protein [Nematostella vectensis]|eukprot:XP_001633211.1 predicted protein [Nematostella vectensis]
MADEPAPSIAQTEAEPLQDENACPKQTQDEYIGLRRNVGLSGAVAFLVGTIIGSGIFATPRWVLLYTGSVGLSLLVWALCGMIALFGSLSYVELALMIPRCGGEYAYLMQAFGPFAAFLYSWISVCFLKPATVLILLAFGAYVIEPFFPHCSHREDLVPVIKILAASALGVITIVNCASVKWSSRIQIAFTVGKMIAILMLVLTGIVRIAQGHVSSLKDSFQGTATSLGMVGFAFYNGLFSYDGWNQLNFFVEEIKEPNRTVPRAIWIAIPLVTASYVLVNIGYLSVLTPDELRTSNAVAVTLASRMYGVMAWTIPILVAFSTFGSANGNFFSGGRLAYAAAREGHLPELLAMVHTKRHTPIPAILFSSTISCIMLIPDSSKFETLLNFGAFIVWLFYGVTMFSIIWMRVRQKDKTRPYKVPIILPCLMTLLSIYLVVAPFYQAPLPSFYALLAVLSGIPVYLFFVRYKVLPQCIMDRYARITVRIQLVLGVALPKSEKELI